jgi:hypothetical protein
LNIKIKTQTATTHATAVLLPVTLFYSGMRVIPYRIGGSGETHAKAEEKRLQIVEPEKKLSMFPRFYVQALGNGYRLRRRAGVADDNTCNGASRELRNATTPTKADIGSSGGNTGKGRIAW